jgi:hypothetical protein
MKKGRRKKRENVLEKGLTIGKKKVKKDKI